jgi:hypothetical protein
MKCCVNGKQTSIVSWPKEGRKSKLPSRGWTKRSLHHVTCVEGGGTVNLSPPAACLAHPLSHPHTPQLLPPSYSQALSPCHSLPSHSLILAISARAAAVLFAFSSVSALTFSLAAKRGPPSLAPNPAYLPAHFQPAAFLESDDDSSHTLA